MLRQCLKAKRSGIKEGSALSLAQAFLPNAQVKDYDPIADFKVLYKLCTWTHRYTPLNAMDFELIEAYKLKLLWKINPLHYGINLDITGTERINKGEHTLVKNINDKMLRARFEARIAIASTLGAAWALSRYIPEKIFISNNAAISNEIGKLPIEALRLTAKASEDLKQVGIKNIATLLTLSRKAIAKRYGSKTLQRLDQALGETPESISPVPMPKHWAVVREFEYALNNHEQIVATVLELIEELVKVLAEKGKRARSFQLLLQGEDLWGIPYRMLKEFSILIASSNAEHIRNVLFPLVERLSLPGPIYLIGLSTKDTEAITHSQTDLEGATERRTESLELINQLAAEVGPNNVKEIRFANSFLPESSFVLSPIGQSDPSALLESQLRARPSKLLEKPEEISAIAMLPDCPPIKIKWQGDDLKVIKGFGPERITTPWFQSDDCDLISRDYYRIEDERGRWLWIFRNTKTYKWFLQGLWV